MIGLAMKNIAAAVAAALALALPHLASADLVFATWNVAGGEQNPADLRVNARDMNAEVGPVDVLVLQEVISAAQVEAIAEGIGLEHWAISDFSPPPEITGAWFNSLEVAVISALPIEAAAEWDTTGNEANGDGYLRYSFGGGAIDHLLVAGPRAADFGAAVTPEAQGTSYFGSDHRPVIAVVPEQ